MDTNDKVYFSVRLKEATLIRLRKHQHPGQALSGIIEELLDRIDWVERNKAIPTIDTRNLEAKIPDPQNTTTKEVS